MTDPIDATYRFADFQFDARTGDLVRGDHVVRLAPQPALVLSSLLDNAGDLVTRATLRRRLWPDTVVEFDKGLNFCVREVRSALGDSAARPRFVETLPRRGYRFIAPVERVRHGTRAGPARSAAGALRRYGRYGARSAAALLAVALTALLLAQATSSAHTPDPRARELGEMGGYLLTRNRGDDTERSIRFFRDALAVDPGYARAHAGLGNAYIRLGRPEEGKASLRRSLELDPRLWTAHLGLAFHAFYRDYQRAEARSHFRRALDSAPDEVAVRHSYAWFLAVQGELEAALAMMRTALELDPVSPRVHGDVGRLFYLAGRQDEAVAHCRRTLELEPAVLRHRDCVVHALAELGALEEARDAAAATMEAHDAAAGLVAAVRAGPAVDGLGAYWRWAGRTIEALAGVGADSHVHAAAAWARAGAVDRAFDALEAAYAVRCPVLPQMAVDPALRLLAGDARFADLLRRIGATPAG